MWDCFSHAMFIPTGMFLLDCLRCNPHQHETWTWLGNFFFPLWLGTRTQGTPFNYVPPQKWCLQPEWRPTKVRLSLRDKWWFWEFLINNIFCLILPELFVHVWVVFLFGGCTGVAGGAVVNPTPSIYVQIKSMPKINEPSPINPDVPLQGRLHPQE